jgi:predicted nucleotidyltransferase
MSFNSDKWLELLVERIRKTFGNRVLYIGHTGSYARGEATENSDIDVNVVLDCLSINDLNVYRRIIQSMPYQ